MKKRFNKVILSVILSLLIFNQSTYNLKMVELKNFIERGILIDPPSGSEDTRG